MIHPVLKNEKSQDIFSGGIQFPHLDLVFTRVKKIKKIKKKKKKKKTVYALEKCYPIFSSVGKDHVCSKERESQYLFHCRTKKGINVLYCQYVDHHIEILNHDRDISNVDLNETAIFYFSMLSSKPVERHSKKREDKTQKQQQQQKQKQWSVLPL